MIKIAVAAVLLVLPQAVAAQAPCLTRQEVRTMIAFTAPSLIEAAAAKCAASLPADAFLRTGARTMSERLRIEGAAEAEGAAAVVAKMAGGKMPEGISQETMQSLIRDIMGAEIAKGIKPADCGLINDLAASLAPLPASNFATMMAVLFELGASKGKSPLSICKG